jgi:plastocyanin
MAVKDMRVWLLPGALGIGLCLVPIVGATQAAADAVTVRIDNFTFTPQNITVKAGSTVTFENDDDIPHLVAANDGSFRSAALDTKDKFAFSFTKVGDFPYFCALHPHMQGKVTVVP